MSDAQRIYKWEESGIQTIDLPAPDAKNAWWSDHELLNGERNYEFGKASGAYDHISMRQHRVPEGNVILARCAACAGRHEELLDFRVYEAKRTTEGGRQMIASALLRQLTDLKAGWMDQHVDCIDAPGAGETTFAATKWTLSDPARRFVDRAVADARRRLQFGNTVHAFLNILLSNGEGFAVPFGHFPDGTDAERRRARTLAFLKMHFSIREYVRARTLSIDAAIVMSEAWMVKAPEQQFDGLSERERRSPDKVFDAATKDLYIPTNPHRTERLLTVAATPTFALGWMAAITRRHPRKAKFTGPATVGPMEAWPLYGESQIVDGVCASTTLGVPDPFGALGATR
jgi:hypothetical protein